MHVRRAGCEGRGEEDEDEEEPHEEVVVEDEREQADVGGHAVLERAPVEHDAGRRARVVPRALHARQRRRALLEARVAHADAARLDQLHNKSRAVSRAHYNTCTPHSFGALLLLLPELHPTRQTR